MDDGYCLLGKGLETATVSLQSYFANCMEKRDIISLIGALTYSKQDVCSLLYLLQLTCGSKNVLQKRKGLDSTFRYLLCKEAKIFKSHFVEQMFPSNVQEAAVRIQNEPGRQTQRQTTSKKCSKKAWRKKPSSAKKIPSEITFLYLRSNFPKKTYGKQHSKSTFSLSPRPLSYHHGRSQVNQTHRTKTHFTDSISEKSTLNFTSIAEKNSLIAGVNCRKVKHPKNERPEPKCIVGTRTGSLFKRSAGVKKNLTSCVHPIRENCGLCTETLLSFPRVKKALKSGSKHKLVVVGGIVSSENLVPSRSVYLYDPMCNSWQTLTSMRHARVNHGVAEFGGHLYVAGGNRGEFTQTNTMERYCFLSRSWTDVFPMTEVREELGLVNAGNGLYAIGGYNGTRDLASIEKYYPNKDIWRFLEPLRMCRAGASVVADERYIYVIGGSCDQRHTTTLETYDTYTHEWGTGLPSMREARSYCCAAMIENKIYVIGGFNSTGYLNTCEVLDLKSQQWTQFPSMIRARMNAGVGTVNNIIYIFGGESDDAGFLSSVESYDMKRKKWEIIGKLPSTLTGCRAALVQFRADENCG